MTMSHGMLDPHGLVESSTDEQSESGGGESGGSGQGGTELSGTTTDATETELLVDGEAGSRLDIGAGVARTFSALVVARDSANDRAKGWRIDGVIARSAAGTVAVVGAATKTTLAVASGAESWDVAFEADDTNKALVCKATGAAATTIAWKALVLQADSEV